MKSQLEKTKLSLLTILCNASQIYRRSIPKECKEKYQQNLKEIIREMIKKIDLNELKNEDIRNSIKKLAEVSNVSVGASQKAVNVYLKFYCIIANKAKEILKELDCPIDSKVQKRNSLKKISLKDINFEDYVEMQNILEDKYDLRILADIEAYDEGKVY